MKKGDARKLSLKPVQPKEGNPQNEPAMISDKSLDKARIRYDIDSTDPD
jgi:hypothetical protein